MLHGTRPQKSGKSRISLRYDIKPNEKNSNAGILINKFLKSINGSTFLSEVRNDIDFSTYEQKKVKFQKILK